MSGNLRCPVCRRDSFLTRDGLEFHLAKDHSLQVLAAELVLRVYPPVPAAEQTCTKRKFPSQDAALAALISAALSKSPNRAEKRTYYCNRCGNWHLTKQDERTPA